MKARLVEFGEIEVEGKRYTHDVVIAGGKVRKRRKGPSKQFREKSGHTPLSVGEEIPWGGKRLIIGTGAHGALPIMDEVLAEAKRRGIEVIAASHIGSLSAVGGSEEGPGVRHPALHVLTGVAMDRCALPPQPLYFAKEILLALPTRPEAAARTCGSDIR
jgi:hypothetical protein